MAKKTLTSASANKLLRQLENDKYFLESQERSTCTYVLAKDEEAEPPLYDYAETQKSIDEIDARERAIRHALHRFNMETVLPDLGITVDEALIRMAQLSRRARRLDNLRSTQAVAREHGRFSGNLIEYRYANFDVNQAKADYEAVTDQINALQLKIDLCNQTIPFEVDL